MSNLEDTSKVFRDNSVVKNTYKTEDQYVAGHKNALSDGDEKGKGEKNSSVGSATDIKTRNTLSTKNTYNKNKEYDAGSVE